jgi:membrane protein DedA with SNARE-associated domain
MLQHPSQELIHILAFWGYPMMLLLMTLEGPVVTMVAAFLASMGYFNVFIVFGLSVAGDVIGDVILYHIGYFGGTRVLAKAEKILKVSAATVEKLKAKFHENSAKIIFYVKSTTGLSYITFITAGTLQMKLSKFVTFSILGGLVWSGFLVAVGYFFGYAADHISEYIKYAGVIIFIGAVLFFSGLTLYKKRQAKEILE